MFKKITAATIVLSGLVLSSSAHAVDVSLEKFVGSLVAQAVSATKQELTYNVQAAVLTANNTVSMDSQDRYATTVTITDIKSDEVNVDVESDKAE